MNTLRTLLSKFMVGTITGAETEELALIAAVTEDEVLLSELEMLWEEWPGTEILDESTSNEMLQSILTKKPLVKRQAPVRKLWVRWVAAACIVAAIAVVGILTYNHSVSPVGVHANDNHDVAAPSNTRAVITLADGSKVYLDSAGSGTIARQNNVNVVKGDSGEIRYALFGKGEKRAAESLSYNTLFNPRGSKVISLTLSDGTRVWLNSESSLKYPTAFTATSREVEITGEAYFEVKHDAKQPFKVHLPNGGIVEDIGTAFNVNAYDDEDALKVTLLEGSVRVKSEVGSQKSEKTIRPGEQAILVNSGLRVASGVDLDEVMAWKNGVFQFGDGTDVKEIMRQLERWYDIDVEYKGDLKGHVAGGISRSVNVSRVLKMIEMTGTAKFTVEGKKVIVTP